MIRFVARRVDGVEAVEMLDGDGRRVGMIYVEEDGQSISVMSDSFAGTFCECVEFRHAQVAAGLRTPPVVKMTFKADIERVRDKTGGLLFLLGGRK